MSAVLQSAAGATAAGRLHRIDASSQVLPEIYRDDVNLAIWQRQLDAPVHRAAQWVVEHKPSLQLSAVVTPDNAAACVDDALGGGETTRALSADIAQLVDMFACLFDLRGVGLRLSTLDRAMCSRFHVDVVPCRLVTTFCGVATEWLADAEVDRSKLGRGNGGKPDGESGLYRRPEAVQLLGHGDVALLKGERWEGNRGGGLVHRSPAMRQDTRRLLMTLDFFDG